MYPPPPSDYRVQRSFHGRASVKIRIARTCRTVTSAGQPPVVATGCPRRGRPAVVLYLPADRDELLRRLAERNEREDANAPAVSPEALDDFLRPLRCPG